MPRRNMVDPVKGNEISRGPSKGVTHGVGCGCDAPFPRLSRGVIRPYVWGVSSVGTFEYRGDGCFCQIGKGVNAVVSINNLIMFFLYFGRGCR